MHEAISVILGNGFGNSLDAFDVYVLEVKVPASVELA